jgi:type I restriction enzyme R subunit
VAKFVVEHWEERRAAMEGKAMIVTMSRDIAARLHDEIRKLRPAWHDEDGAKAAMKVIMTGGPDDPEHMARHVRGKAQRKALADRFKDPAGGFRLAIVVDMWLTRAGGPAAESPAAAGDVRLPSPRTQPSSCSSRQSCRPSMPGDGATDPPPLR